jgi:predicted  nucleic acid-binding Zn-ribbon protein
MFKNVIAPVQAWLLSQGRCVGCGLPLSTGKITKHAQGEKIVCAKCGRIFIKEGSSGKYRRALFEEV